ncbi:MAG: hybrid sensor histidine kinase/response regulator transcription factor, partial [Bacteroidales bacterium]
SNAGLMKYNLIRETWHYYNKNDGLPTSQFNQSSVCKMSDGKILFGSIKGIVIFDPDKIADETSDNNIILFSDLLLYNHPVRPNDETGILKSHISKCDQIVLNANQRMFTLRFTSINYNANNNVSYAYLLEGFNDTWTYITNRELTFSELPVGKYRLHIKSNTLNNELPSEVSIDIIISPPWWCSTPMIILYLVLMIIAAICIFKIIQERIRLYNELNQEKIEKQKVEELQNMQTQFFINVSHELKTPLTLITSPLENLLDVCKSNEWQKKQLELVYRNAQSLSGLIDELINFEKAEQGQTKLRVSQEEIMDFIRKVYSSFYLLAKGKNINYQIDMESPSLITLFDPFILKNILNNFLSNAFKFTPANGAITVSVFSENDYLIIAVKDTGIGISKERQKYIFDRFYTAAPDMQIGGTGIGLAYAKLLAELHHGFLKVSSEERKGALFSFYLPLSETVYHISEYGECPNISIDYKPQYYLNPVENAESTDFSLPDTDQAKQSILIVDDNLNMTEYLSENLSQIYNVSIAHDGQQATEKLSGHTYDLIICDVMMPHVNGLQFCKRVRQNITTSHIPIILLSAKSDLEHAISGLSIGADDYIAKPFSLKLLKTKIQNILLTRHRLKELYASSPEKPTKTAYFSKDQEFLSKATKFIEDHLAESEFSVNELAYMMGLSRSALYLRFKAITGESISDFIQKIRFRTAMELLNTGRYNVSEISMMTGFSSPSYFTKVFKKHFGYLPTEYIKQVNVTE